MHKSKVVNTKRERGSSNNKNQNNNNISKQPLKTQSFLTLGALVTGFTSTPTTMSDEINQADTLIIKPTSIDIINGQSLSKSLQVKISNETKNGHETLDEQNSISSLSHIDHSIDSGLSSEITYIEIEKTNGDDELHSTSTNISTNHQRESSPISGVIIPEEKRVTDRVKVFEAVANNNDNQIIKNGNTKKKSLTSSSFSIGDHKHISSTSSIETSDTQSINEIKASKTKSKKSSLKKQIQNLLKIDKSSIQDEINPLEEQITNGKKNKKDNNSATTSTFKHQSSPKSSVEPLEIQIPPAINNNVNLSSATVSKLINTFQTNDIEQIVVAPKLNTPPLQLENLTSSSSTGVSQFDTSINNTADILSSNSPIKSVPSIITHSPMLSGVGDPMKTSIRSVSVETGTRNQSPIQRYGQQEIGNSSSYSSLNQSTNTQVTDNLRVQHQREKQELAELNDRFRGYLDRVKILESKNLTLTSQLDDIAKAWGAASQAIVVQYTGPLDRLRQEVNDCMLYEADLQTRLRRSHYNIDNYRSLIHDETSWNDRQEGKREQLKLEYEHSCAELSALQKSYKQVEDQLKTLLKQREDYLNEINQLNEQSYKSTLDRIKSDLEVQTLREEIPFLNDIHAHLLSEFEQLKPANGIDAQLFYRQELEKAIRDIRRDFETLNAAQRKEMEDYYHIKIDEMQNEAKKLPLQPRQDNLSKISEQIKSTKFELNDTQKLLISEKDKFKELQDRLAKLEEEYSFVRSQRSAAHDNVNKELGAAQERIEQLTEEIDTILRSNITLESEINIYRRLLDSETNRLTQQTIEVVSSPEPTPASFGSELGKVFNKKIKKGPIAIKDCAPDGKCITLENTSNDKDVDVSNWTLKRTVEGSSEISYTIPYGLIMKHGNELKIYARSAQNAHHRPPSQVVNDKLESWGMGTECETKLFNEQGEERASHSQKIVFGSESSRNLP
ncbi:unnamed protein product [Rotaria sp. Silwood2]|nr:unnamed protein product [Rotaria sp. Silwood2]CAF3946210.1 unnamed protein product [Rotaria sp. Silwood2]CAF3974202.1 unnamed protein product [Rotaria sp. Silwood2]CAF4074769.1 unnamed protein product [Rotaria sp. Silwood2]